MADPTKGSATPYQRVRSLLGAQRGDHQDAAYNEGVGVLDIPGDLVASKQASVTTTGAEGERMGV